MPDMNTVSVRIPTILRTYTAGAAEVSATEGSLREVIAGLDVAYPGLGGRILDDGGRRIDQRQLSLVFLGHAAA